MSYRCPHLMSPSTSETCLLHLNAEEAIGESESAKISHEQSVSLLSYHFTFLIT